MRTTTTRTTALAALTALLTVAAACSDVSIAEADHDSDGYTEDEGDCNDQDVDVHPGAQEICDAIDNDCDGEIDEGFDVDEDTFTVCGPDGLDGTEDDDCNDTDASINPLAPEVHCDGIDNDCNDETSDEPDGDGDGYSICEDCDDEDAELNFDDEDGDGFGTCEDDCNDHDPDENPADEDEDGASSCDGDCDDADAALNLDDVDGDGWSTCDGDCDDDDAALSLDDGDADGHTTCDGDCDDEDAAVHPGAEDVCDDIDDNDCDGVVDPFESDDDADGASECGGDCDDTDPALNLDDLDGDGFDTCADDCDDSAATIYPGATELCDGLDNDCDGSVPPDEVDADGDGYLACEECGDGDATTYPGAAELCDGEDNDCDGGLPAEEDDVDGDGWMACEECDDDEDQVYPGAPDICDHVDDNDCDGVTDPMESDDDGDGASECGGDCDDADAAQNVADQDGDGYDTCSDDCNDQLGTVHPGATEQCNGVDDDCDGVVPADEHDGDGDGYFECEGDCDEADAAVYPGADDVCDAVLDNDCDGVTDPLESDDDADGAAECDGDCNDADADLNLNDIDADGWTSCEGDCDDLEGSVYPGAVEQCNGADDDCDGSVPIDEADDDGDGYRGCEDDCDDGDEDINPGETEVCNDWIDNDCDGTDNDCQLAGEINLADADDLIDGGDALDALTAWRGPRGGGDIDGDGLPDIVVGALLDDVGLVDNGAAYLFYDSMYGVVDVSVADAVLVGEAAGDAAGAVAIAGDVDGDGFADVVVGARYQSEAANDAGAAYLVRGPVTGQVDLSNADSRWTGEAAEDRAGLDVASAGDINGDGLDDVLIGARFQNAGGEDAGAAYVLLGPVADGDHSLSGADAKLVGEEAGDNAGYFISTAGDVNDDGLMDLMVGAPFNDAAAFDAGAAYVVYGPVSGVVDLASADAILLGEAEDDWAGIVVGAAGDLDGDAHGDVLIGAPYNDAGGIDTGAVYIQFGPVQGSINLADSTAKLHGEQSDDRAGTLGGASAAGDVNGDGFDDLLVGSALQDAGGTDAGAAYLVYGPILGDVPLGDADAKLLGEADHDHACSVWPAQDLDGDGYDDFLVGANQWFSNGPGTAYVVYGRGL